MNVDTPYIVTTTWTRTNSDDDVETLESNSGRVVVYDPYSTGFNKYQSRIEISALNSCVNSGLYTCEVFIDSNSSFISIYDSDNDNDSTTFQVLSKWY